MIQLYNLHRILSKLELHADNALLSVGPSTQHELSLASCLTDSRKRTLRLKYLHTAHCTLDLYGLRILSSTQLKTLCNLCVTSETIERDVVDIHKSRMFKLVLDSIQYTSTLLSLQSAWAAPCKAGDLPCTVYYDRHRVPSIVGAL